jgi:mannosyltransferase OCH1-like enzyme
VQILVLALAHAKTKTSCFFFLQIWLGSPLPSQFVVLRDSWKRVLGNSDSGHWQFRLWTDDDVTDFGMQNKAAFDAASNYGEKSDIFRYEILERYGGIYVDTDFECIQSVDKLHQLFSFYAGISNTGTVELNNGLIGAQAQHPILAKLIKVIGVQHSSSTQTTSIENLVGLNAKNSPFALIAQMAGPISTSTLAKCVSDSSSSTIERTGPGLFTRTVMGHIMSNSGGASIPEDTAVFPPSFFYPMPNNVASYPRPHPDSHEFLQPESFALHHWACSWQNPSSA